MESIHSHNESPHAISAGFTLIELLVVLAIIGIISVVALNSQSSFNKTLILANTAYDIALTIRSAQTFGIGSRAVTGTTIANAGYGVYFEAATPGSFVLFADTYPVPSNDPLTNCHPQVDTSAPDARPGNCVYDAGYGNPVQTERVMDYVLGNGMTISDLCAYTGNGNTRICANGRSQGYGNLTNTSLDIVFARPNPDASIRGNDGSPYASACITIASPQGGERYVRVESSGAITASATPCP